MVDFHKAAFNRTERVFGKDMMDTLCGTRVIIFGTGGVGSWCAEGLIRSGIGSLTIVDPDRVCVTNINRQLMATSSSVGRYKVDVLRERLLDINPEAEVIALRSIYSEENWESFGLDSYDYVIDAMDSLRDKAHLILRASESRATFFCSMGAAVKIDPSRVRVAEFWDVRGCPLAAHIRKKFRQSHSMPARKFLCVYDDEVLPNSGCEALRCGSECDMCPKGADGLDTDLDRKKAVVNGTTAHITAIFGFTLCGLVMQDVRRRTQA